MSDKDYYESGGDGYSMSKLATTDSRVYNLSLRLDELFEGSKILDIGCGDLYLSKLHPKLQWSGIDIHPLPGVTPHDLTITPYPFPEASFDAVVCSEVLEHLFEPLEVIQEAHRLLKNYGKLYITVPNFNSFDFHLQDHREQLYTPNKSHSVEHIRNYTPASMAALLERKGFEPESVIGNSAHMCQWLRHARDVLQTTMPTVPPVELDHLLGQMFPDRCAGFLIIAKKCPK